MVALSDMLLNCQVPALGQSPNRGRSPLKLEMLGGAEPRLTSGGEAEADGVKFYDWLLIFKTVSHIRRRSHSGPVK
jgi:hypothetical protein